MRFVSRFSGVDLDALAGMYGNPLLPLDLARAVAQRERRCCAVPFVCRRCAVKVMSQPTVIVTITSLGGSSVSQTGARSLCCPPRHRLRSHHPCRTEEVGDGNHPPSGARHPHRRGRQWGEAARSRIAPADVLLLIRLAIPIRAPQATSPAVQCVGLEAEILLSQCVAQGSQIAGFCFQVGSQLDSVGPSASAIADALELMDLLQGKWVCNSFCSTSVVDSRLDSARMSRESSRSPPPRPPTLDGQRK